MFHHMPSIKKFKKLLCVEKNLPLGSFRQVLTQSGMIHLMVVSGAHLMFLEKSLNIFPQWKYKKILTLWILSFYTLFTQMNPPILRALVSIFLREFSQKFSLHWDSYYRLILSGLICLTLNPYWITSTSLQLSLVGTLAFSYSQHSRLMAQFLSFAFIVPLISQWSALHPLSILLNWILFPFFSAIIFPFSLLSFLFPVFYPLTQFFMDRFILILTNIQPFLEFVPVVIKPIPFSLRWIYVCLLLLIFKCLTMINHKAENI